MLEFLKIILHTEDSSKQQRTQHLKTLMDLTLKNTGWKSMCL